MGSIATIQNGEWVRWVHGGHEMIGRVVAYLPDREAYQAVSLQDDIYKGMMMLVPRDTGVIQAIQGYCENCGRYDT